VLTVASRLLPAEAAVLLDDWQFGQDKMSFGVAIKLSYWAHLPWAIVGVSHHDINRAREAGRKCLHLFDQIDKDQREREHHLTRRFLDPEFEVLNDGVALRPQLEMFVHGAELDNEVPSCMRCSHLCNASCQHAPARTHHVFVVHTTLVRSSARTSMLIVGVWWIVNAQVHLMMISSASLNCLSRGAG
jgi:hypothetical protein